MFATNLNRKGISNIKDFLKDITAETTWAEWNSKAPQMLFDRISNFHHNDPTNLDDPIAILEVSKVDTDTGRAETYLLMADEVDWAEDDA